MSTKLLPSALTLDSGAQHRKPLRGAFINTAEAICSIHESGRMVYRCIAESDFYTLDYFSLDKMDLDHFRHTGIVRRPGESATADRLVDYDFFVFNWHFVTMASDLAPEHIARLSVPKFTVVLELAPNDPLKLVPPGVFDGYIALDPAASATESIFPFPRPLEGDPWKAKLPEPLQERDTPVIGSFGLGTPGKGFELLVEAVNREFETAIVRINIPSGTYVFTEGFHHQDYPKYLESICRKIAKPGVEVRFTYDFMSPEELVAWCAYNDLNCFMYTRSQPGLSATTDQAVMSGRPLLTLSNDTFRHIHTYIPPYPVMGLREAIANAAPLVRKLQQDWSRESFGNTFHRMLSAFGLINLEPDHPSVPAMAKDRTTRVMIVSRRGLMAVDIRHYTKRLADCLGRSGQRKIVHAQYRNMQDLGRTIREGQPGAVILVDFAVDEQEELNVLLRGVSGKKIILAEHPLAVGQAIGANDTDIIVLPRQPIIPFFTIAAGLLRPPCIWLVGFADATSHLEQVLAKIVGELPAGEICLEVRESQRADFISRLSHCAEYASQGGGLRLSVISLPTAGVDVIHRFAECSLVVFHNDPSRSDELEDLSCLAMTTERAVVFTRHGAFSRFLGRGTYFEDHSVAALMALGVAAQIKLYYDFGEWQFAAGIERVLSGDAPASNRPNGVLSLTADGFLQMAGEATHPLPEVLTPVELPRDPAPAAITWREGGGRTGGPLLLMLVGLTGVISAKPSAFSAHLAEAWEERGEAIRFVVWNVDLKRLQLPTQDEWEQSGLPDVSSRHSAIYPRKGDPAVLIGPASCAEGDWLLVPEFYQSAPGQRPLVEMDMILQARRVGLRCAFVVHGADALRAPEQAGAAAGDYEHYMQALLLADALIPISDAAAFDLNDFFVQYQLADFVPLTRTLHFPEGLNAEPGPHWSVYVRTLRGLLHDAADRSRSLTSLYYWLDEDDATRPRFGRRLAEALAAGGIALIPVGWDHTEERLVLVEEATPDLLDWAMWAAPGTKTAPSWLLIPDPIEAALLERVTGFAHRQQVRVAAILNTYPGKRDRLDCAALAQLDKVLAVSESQFADFYGFLLGWRGKLNSAEDRFKFVAGPDVIDGPSKRTTPKRANPSIIRVVVWVSSQNSADLAAVFDAAADAVRRSAIRLKFHFISLTSDNGDRPNLAPPAAMTELPGARWTWDDVDRSAVERLQNADFAIFIGPNAETSRQVAESVWCAVPCLVAETSATTFKPGPGLMCADLHHVGEFAASILKLAEPAWRRSLAQEAIGRPSRSWHEYAHDIAVTLATDRLTDGLQRPDAGRRPDVFTTLVNLARRPKLSLCISTYNRAGWLAASLRNIFNQKPTPRNDLEVLVVDNASVDGTPDVVKPYLDRVDFRYIRNSRNVGMLGNLAVTAQQAKGDYIWILGDDDLTRAGVIERVLELVKQYPRLGLIYMNYGYSSAPSPSAAEDMTAFLNNFNVLEPAGHDVMGTVKEIAARCENFYTAIYSHVYRRDHGLRAYCQDTSGRIFSTMLSCVPTAYYVLHYMADLSAYWIGEPALVVNSNVSWQAYGPLLELEQLPRTWDLAERMGTDPVEVDRRRANRLWLIEMMWRQIFENDTAGNSAYVSAARVLMRLKHLSEFDKYIGSFVGIYQKAYEAGHPGAKTAPESLFRFVGRAGR